MAKTSRTRFDVFVSTVSFWTTTALAGGLFAASLLAPDLERQSQLRLDLHGLERECHYLEQSVEHMDRIVEVLRHDPHFRSELNGFRPTAAAGEIRMVSTVAGTPAPRRDRTELYETPVYAPLVSLLAQDELARKAGFGISGGMALAGLTFFRAPKRRLPEPEDELYDEDDEEEYDEDEEEDEEYEYVYE